MKPETGDRAIFTQSRGKGYVTAPAWSRTEPSLFRSDRGYVGSIYRVPVLGGDEHLSWRTPRARTAPRRRLLVAL